MYAYELFEQNKTKIVVTYPGRFQPFHQGHAGVFAQLQKKFGAENVYVLTSNDTSSAKSPFNFSDKYQLITAAGVPGNHIIETNKMYVLPDGFDPATTILVTAVGAPDADRLKPDSYLKKDNPTTGKKAGDPSYYKSWGSDSIPVTADKHGYVVVIPEIKKSIKIKGKAYDVSHGTECRNLWNAIRKNAAARKEFLTQMYARPTAEIAAIYDKIPESANEDIEPDSAYTASPIPGKQVTEKIAYEPDEKGLQHDALTMPQNTIVIDTPGDLDWYKLGHDIANLQLADPHEYGQSDSDVVITTANKEEMQRLMKQLDRLGMRYKLISGTADQPEVHGETPPLTEMGGVGVIASKKQAKDPRYSTSLTVDVRPGAVQKSLKAFKLSEDQSSVANVKDLLVKFLPMVSEQLKLKKLPSIKIQKHVESADGQATFGRFDSNGVVIYLAIANRHPVDILRTLAHELVHFKQFLDGKLYNGAGDTGTPIENQANAEAGVIMRHFNSTYPEAINSTPADLPE